MKAVQFHRFGGPEVLTLETVPEPPLEPGEVLVRIRAAALNHVDLDIRDGVSRFEFAFPHTLGIEGAGEVAEVGPGVKDVKVGDRVAVSYVRTCGQCEFCRTGQDNLCVNRKLFGEHIPGSYAEYMKAPSNHCLHLPENVSFDAAAASMVAFGTAWHALISRGGLRAGEWVLIHSVGSGVSSAALQICKLAGAMAIVTASQDQKLDRATADGADYAINYRREDPFQKVLEITGGRGVDMVFDVVGGETFVKSLTCMATNARLISIGAHSGERVQFDIIEFFRRHVSLISSHTQTREELRQIFGMLSSGLLKPVIYQTFPLAEASSAHVLMARREHYGKILLHT